MQYNRFVHLFRGIQFGSLSSSPLQPQESVPFINPCQPVSQPVNQPATQSHRHPVRCDKKTFPFHNVHVVRLVLLRLARLDVFHLDVAFLLNVFLLLWLFLLNVFPLIVALPGVFPLAVALLLKVFPFAVAPLDVFPLALVPSS